MLNLISFTIFMAMVLITSIFMDVKGISDGKKQVDNSDGSDNVEPSTDFIYMSKQPIEETSSHLDLSPPASVASEEDLLHDSSAESRPSPKLKITKHAWLDRRFKSPLQVPDSKYQSSTPENLSKEQEKVPASVPRLLAYTPNNIDISSSEPGQNENNSKPSLYTTCTGDENGLPEYTEQYLKKGASHKRSFSSVSTSLSMSSQKSMAQVTSKVKRAFSKLHRPDAAVSPTDVPVHKPNTPQRTHSDKIFSHKTLNKLLKRG
ncbi:hypothetical protein INT43_007410 [Umbelopsis isabellina]|uniref:Uncharacterized protein n=1 Tax=Mortierella isabellina TaxID=91625 RepID=A0A8H7UGS7_MORIS|nr:hypothetical protein INT43_007410 [Umbelopsis isabellina]